MVENKKERVREIVGRAAVWGKTVVTPKRIKKCAVLLVLLAVAGGIGKLGLMKAKAARRVAEDAAQVAMMQKLAERQNISILSTDAVKSEIAGLLGTDADSLNVKRLSLADHGFDRPDRDEKKHEDRKERERKEKDKKREKRWKDGKGRNAPEGTPFFQESNEGHRAFRRDGKGPVPGASGSMMGPAQRMPEAQVPAAPEGQTTAPEGTNAQMPAMASQPVPMGPGNRANRNGRPLFYKAAVEKGGMTYHFTIDARNGKVVDSKVRQTTWLEKFLF
jgi:hypothetical protein